MHNLTLQLFSSNLNAAVGDEVTFTVLATFDGPMLSTAVEIRVVDPAFLIDCVIVGLTMIQQSPTTATGSFTTAFSLSGQTLMFNHGSCTPFTSNPNNLTMYAFYPGNDPRWNPNDQNYFETVSANIQQQFQNSSAPVPPPSPPPTPGGGGPPPNTGSGQPAFDTGGNAIAGQFSRLMPCPNFIPCPGTDLPFINHSAAAPDILQFVCMGFGPLYHPPLGSSFSNVNGAASGLSSNSATEACLNADSNALVAVVAGDSPWTVPSAPVFFTNTPQTCPYVCPTTGAVEIYTTPPALFTALTQVGANQLALEYGCLQAQLLAGCTGAFENTAQKCIAACPGGTEQTFTTPAGVFSAATQAEANSLAYQYACLAAQIGCPPPPAPSPSPVSPGFPVGVFHNTSQTATLECEDGTPFAYTVAAGLFTSFSQIEANRSALNYAQQQAQAHQICMSSISPIQLTLNVPTTLTIFAAGAFLDSSQNLWQLVSGTLPLGYSLSEIFAGTTLAIEGTALLPGTYTFTIKVTAPNGDNQQKTFTLSVTGGTICATPATGPSAGPGPGIRGTTLASFGNFPAGRYVVNYQNGALQYNGSGSGAWHLNFGTDPIDGNFSGYSVIYGGGSVQFPDSTAPYSSQHLVESAFAGANTIIQHTGGAIQMQFSDVDFSDETSGNPSPTFCLAALS